MRPGTQEYQLNNIIDKIDNDKVEIRGGKHLCWSGHYWLIEGISFHKPAGAVHARRRWDKC